MAKSGSTLALFAPCRRDVPCGGIEETAPAIGGQVGTVLKRAAAPGVLLRACEPVAFAAGFGPFIREWCAPGFVAPAPRRRGLR